MIIYNVIHYYDVDGGFGDAIPREDVIVTFSSKTKADAFVEKYAKPHIYEQPYMNLVCGELMVREQEIDVEPDENEMWWLNNEVIDEDEEED